MTRLKTPAGSPTSSHDLGEHERVERRDLARLEHDGAAGGERRRDLVRDLVQRVVPRRDRADDPDRLAHDQRVADLLLPGDLLARAAASSAKVSGRQARLDHPRQPDRHAHLGRDQRGELVAALARASRRSRRRYSARSAAGVLRPRVERRARGAHRAVGVLGGALRDAAHDLLGGRVDRRRSSRRRRARPTRRRCRACRGPEPQRLPPCPISSVARVQHRRQGVPFQNTTVGWYDALFRRSEEATRIRTDIDRGYFGDADVMDVAQLALCGLVQRTANVARMWKTLCGHSK